MLAYKLRIGEFSQLAQVTVPTLRYYDQVGLLQPVEVDRFTGYRYYSVSQLPRLNRILALKGLGFSLEQISTVLDEELSVEQLRGMLRLRHAQISEQIAEMQSQLVEVEVRLKQIEREEVSTYDIILKRVEPQLVAAVRAVIPNYNEADHSQNAGDWTAWARYTIETAQMGIRLRHFRDVRRLLGSILRNDGWPLPTRRSPLIIAEARIRLGWSYYQEDRFALAMKDLKQGLDEAIVIKQAARIARNDDEYQTEVPTRKGHT
jgi:DNA-binding transcriptional MerR regulator